MESKVISYKIYWMTWFALLCITFLSIGADHIKMPHLRLVLLLLLMLSKATLILLNFMHLSHEKVNLAMTIVVGILVTSLILFFIIAFDANPIKITT